MEEKKIIHFHAEIKCNKGDMAIVDSIMSMLKENLNVIKYTQGFLELLKKREYPRIIDNLSKGKIGSKIIPMARPFKKVYNLIRDLQKKILIKKINNHNILIIGGGGIYSNFFFPLDIDIISKINIPIVLFSPGININLGKGPLSDDVKKSIIFLNNKSTLSSVRDSKTKEALMSLGITSRNIGDPAVHLCKEEDKIEVDSNKFKVGINFGCHGKYMDRLTFNKISSIYCSIIYYLSKKRDIELFYLKHHPKENLAIKYFKKKFPFIKVVDLSPRKLNNFYGKMDLVISMLLHSTIFAFSNNIRVINFAYDNKNISFMKDIGQKSNVLPIDNLPEIRDIYKKLNDLIKSKPDYTRKKDYLRKEMKSFLTDIKRI